MSDRLYRLKSLEWKESPSPVDGSKEFYATTCFGTFLVKKKYVYKSGRLTRRRGWFLCYVRGEDPKAWHTVDEAKMYANRIYQHLASRLVEAV